MPQNTFNNPYLQSSIANAFTNANNALIGRMNSQANREYKMLQLQQGAQQAEAMQRHQDRTFRLSEEAAGRAAELHTHELSKIEAENKQLLGQLEGQNALVDIFSNPNNFKQNDYGQTYLVPEAVSALAAAQARSKGEVNPNILDFTNIDNPDIAPPVIHNGVIFWDKNDTRNWNYTSPASSQIVEPPLPQADAPLIDQQGRPMQAAPTPSVAAAPPA